MANNEHHSRSTNTPKGHARDESTDGPVSAGAPDAPKAAGPKWNQQEIIDRRAGVDRRDIVSKTATPGTNLERRRGPGRRRTDFMRAAEEGEMTDEQFMFIMAIDAFKRVNGKTFPAWTDVLEVIRKLGYRKTMESELNLGSRVSDWTERADAPAGVFKEEGGGPGEEDGLSEAA